MNLMRSTLYMLVSNWVDSLGALELNVVAKNCMHWRYTTSCILFCSIKFVNVIRSTVGIWVSYFAYSIQINEDKSLCLFLTDPNFFKTMASALMDFSELPSHAPLLHLLEVCFKHLTCIHVSLTHHRNGQAYYSSTMLTIFFSISFL